MLKFSQGEGENTREIYVNMNQVCYIAPNGDAGSVLTFCAIIRDEPAYLIVNETPDQIAARPEWGFK
jgi:hypothetical protein